MPLFTLDKTVNIDKKIVRKTIKQPKTKQDATDSRMRKKLLSAIKLVEEKLSDEKDKYLYITSYQELSDYVFNGLNAEIVTDIAIDTETTGLNCFEDRVVGFSLQRRGKKACYIPVLHRDFLGDNSLFNDNLSVEDVTEFFVSLKEFVDSEVVRLIFFNADFDIRMILHSFGVQLPCYFDCYIASKLLNENEKDGGLKPLYAKYCIEENKESLKYSDFFEGIPFDIVPPKVGYLYAAGDAEKTLSLYDFQKYYLLSGEQGFVDCELDRVSSVFFNIEMPLLPVIIAMEERGIGFDKEYATQLHKKYTDLRLKAEQNFYSACDCFKDKIEQYKQDCIKNNKPSKLDTPINIKSPTQLSILIYDILGCNSVDDKSPRGTGVGILEKIDNPVCKAILEYRTQDKLLTTYIDKMPDIICKQTGRIHCRFNQVGTVTGRFSSSDPNMQNIPSKASDIRSMFVPSPGNILISADYSSQEPRITAHFCDDKRMKEAFINKQDIYASVASVAFNYPYEECLEFRPDGTTNKEGKNRRKQAKTIVLSIVYGKGIKSIGEDLGIPYEKAKEVYDSVIKSYPNLKVFEKQSIDMAKKLGYVDTLWGRRRHLPDLQLEPFEVQTDNQADKQFILNQLNNAKTFKDKETIKKKYQDKVKIIDNGGKIADAQRQAINSRIQGSAADMAKIAMIAIENDKVLNDLGFDLLLMVHDEVIGECPIENKEKVKERISYQMIKAGELLSVPIVCDIEFEERWH